jgi:flagellar biosynthetic protein FliS
MNRTDVTYRKTAAEGASGFGLLIALYDTLACDLRRAAEAERSNDIEQRCLEVNHALLVIAHLEDWVRSGCGGELADQLVAFYASLRRDLLEAQVRRSARMLELQMAKVLQLREMWQQFDLPTAGSGAEVLPPAWKEQETAAPAPAPAPAAERRKLSWSA